MFIFHFLLSYRDDNKDQQTRYLITFMLENQKRLSPHVPNLFVQNLLLTIRWVYNFRLTSTIYCNDCICARL